MATAPEPVRSGAERLGDFTTSDRRMVTIALLAVVVGVLGALVAAALYDLIGFFTNLFYFGRLSVAAVPPANTWGTLSIAVPVAGGLLVGLMARFGSERIRGHGIPEALEAILIDRSKIQPKLTVLKPVSSAVSIGTGGPFGAEGPIIMTGGALGSLFGQTLRLSASERKTLLVAGAAAGMSAIFNTPVAAVLLAVELLLFEWRPRSLIPVGAASATAAFLSWYLVPAHGFGPLFPIPLSPYPTGWILAGALLVGLVAGVFSTALTAAVYFFEDAFRRLPIHWMWWPAIGGVVVGIGGLIAVQSLGVGYGTICAMMGCSNGQLTRLAPALEVTVVFVVTLLVVKALIWSIALGSGTSGGVLAPLLIMGGALGLLEAHLLPFGSVPLWVLVSMSATLGGTMRSPFTGVVFALELTHDVTALLPLLVAGLVAEGVTVITMKRSILTEKVARRGVHVAREYSADPLEQVPVRAVMHTGVATVPADLTVEEALRSADVPREREIGLVLLSDAGRPSGFIARGDLRRFLEEGGRASTPVRELGRPLAGSVTPGDPMRLAAERLGAGDGNAIPVVDPDEPTQVVGYLTRDSLLDARVLHQRLDQDRERPIDLAGGLRRPPARPPPSGEEPPGSPPPSP